MLILAFFLQFLFAGVGWHLTLSLAALIAFAFILDFWELLVLDLLAVFIINWQPAPSIALLAFAVIPLGAFIFYKLTRWQGWIGALIAIALGFLIFYAIAAPAMFIQNLLLLAMDMVIGLAAGEIILFSLS